jgi:Ankyrin repeats (3 copies)
MTSHCIDAACTGESPVRLLRSMFPEHKRRATFTQHCRPRSGPSDDRGYTMEAVTAIRSGDVHHLRQLLGEGERFDACNRNGESLLHLACRRGDLQTVLFLIREAGVSVEARDDLGRTVLHDICWRPRPDTQLMDLLLLTAHPSLLLAEDRRGHTPFDYARLSDWNLWNTYLSERRELIERRALLA